MAYQLFQLPKQTQIDSSVRVTAGCKANFYVTGTTTFQDTYADSGLTTPNANPVVADANGVFQAIYLDPTKVYKLTLTTSADVLIYTIDPCNDQLLTQALLGFYLYPRTAAEIAVSVTPTNFAYAEGNVFRYGAVGDGSTNDAVAIQRAINVMAVYGGNVTMPSVATFYNLGSTTLTVPSKVWLCGTNGVGTYVKYAGTGFAIDATGSYNGARDMYVEVTNVAGSGIRFNGVSRFSGMDRFTVQASGTPAASRTGTGITHKSVDADNAFSGEFLGTSVYSLGFLYGTRYLGFAQGVETWTTVTYMNCYNVGDSALKALGSVGVWFDPQSNGVGTVYNGGGSENWGLGLKHESIGIGFYFRGDLEANTVDYQVGESFCGVIEGHNAGTRLEAGANGSANRWYRREISNGLDTDETYYGKRYMAYNQNSANRYEWFLGTEAESLISGGTGGLSKFAIQMQPGTDVGERNWIAVCGHKMAWGSAIPTINTWGVGDITWNTGAAAGGSPGWVCTTAGTPGTWKAMANVAP